MQLSARCYAVTGLAYLPPWSVNAGFIAGEEVTVVVDTGANALAAATIHGYASAVRPFNQIMVINTEPHFDHIGGNSYFLDQGANIYGHEDLERTEEQFAAEQREFQAAIPDAARRAHGEQDAFYHGTRLVNPNRSIRDDALFDLGNCPVEVLLTPGHTPLNLSVWAPGDGVLLCGDLLVNRYRPNLDAANGEPSWRKWLASLDRIERLAPKVILPGHGPVATGDEVPALITSVREVLQQAIDGV